MRYSISLRYGPSLFGSVLQTVSYYVVRSRARQCITVTRVAMILRVWAMYSRSRLILGILLAFWVLEIIPSIITCVMYPSKFSSAWLGWLLMHVVLTRRFAVCHTVSVTQVLDLAYCEVTSSSVIWTRVSAIPELVNGVVMCILVIYQFVKRVLDVYRVTKKLHFNHYMNLLAGQSILYFLLYVPPFAWVIFLFRPVIHELN